MSLTPDPRWANFISGQPMSGLVRPVSLELLEGLSADLAATIDEIEPCGGTELLDTARGLLVTSWFRYEFLAVAALVGFQAVEAVFRQVVYPDATERDAFRNL